VIWFVLRRCTIYSFAFIVFLLLCRTIIYPSRVISLLFVGEEQQRQRGTGYFQCQ